ncbi:MAG: hypothetical protein V7763_05755 [Sulfitobacter sp.]
MQTTLNHAHHVVTHPQHHLRNTAVLAINWERLKAARGQTVDYDHIGPPCYIVGPECPSIAAARSVRISGLVRQIAAQKGYDLPPDAA